MLITAVNQIEVTTSPPLSSNEQGTLLLVNVPVDTIPIGWGHS